MAHTSHLVYSVEKTKGTNCYGLYIPHIVFDHPVDFGSLGLVTEVFTIQYFWKNAKCSKSNLMSSPTKTFAESLHLAETIIKQLDKKIL